jgi:uncharacterized protein YjbI with pentapeptide repeats
LDRHLFSQNLDLAFERLVEPDEDKLEKLAVTLPLSVRDLQQADFDDSDLRKANLRFADLSDAYLASTNLRGANLSSATLDGANLNEANLSGTDLSGATLHHAYLRKANLSGADLDGQQQLDKACGTAAELPPGLTLKPCPPK